jgi:hypothetical protein
MKHIKSLSVLTIVVCGVGIIYWLAINSSKQTRLVEKVFNFSHETSSNVSSATSAENQKKQSISTANAAGISTSDGGFSAGTTVTKETMTSSEQEMDTLLFVITEYRKQIGVYPPVEPSQLAKAITGSNPQNIRYMNWVGSEIPPLLMDPWGTPYNVTILGNNINIRCAGPDKSFGTKDDELYTK